jgi:two-component system chemotaxis sensor kinase CheA
MSQSLPDRLRAIFLGELEDQLIVLNSDLIALESNPADAERLKSLFRVAHTLKGAASAAGSMDVADTCHSLETILTSARDRGLKLGPAEFKILFSGADALAAAGRRLRGAAQNNEGDSATREPEGSQTDGSASSPDSGAAAERAAPDYLRIDPATLDAVLASVEQLLVAIDSVGVHARDARSLGEVATKAAATAARSARQEGGRTRSVDSENQWRRFSDQTARLATNAAADARHLGNAGGELAERTRRLRMRPFGDACEGLPRVVRDLAGELGKDVRLAILGGDVHADRVVLDGLREALVHLVRNAIDHGVEPPPVRAAAGKPAQATITIAASIAGDSISVIVEDDGAGLDMTAIRASFERLGKSVPTDDDAVVAALFSGGVSTRAEATAISGRGVGLDLVRNAVERIHGTIDVSWTKGKGTRFTIQSPLTLATIRALLVKVGTETVALPTAHVERVRRISAADLRQAEGHDVLLGDAGESERPIRLVSLARLLGPPLTERALEQHGNGVVLETQGRRLAVLVDELISEQVVIVRKLDGARSSLPHLSGVAILGGGRIALVANVPRLLAHGLDAPAGATVASATGDEARSRRRILVVDDSVTTRMLEQSVLEAAGYEVKTAVDGANAWEMLAEEEWDLVVSDVEMPRMDGFALCAAIRGSPRLARMPVVLVTALEKQEHRAKGLEVGADAYIGKSSFDQRSLLETIQQLLD